MEENRTTEELRAGTIDDIREFLKKAATIKDPREMWYAVRDILNLLTMMIVPEPDVITPEKLADRGSSPRR